MDRTQLAADLRTGWREHRPYVGVAATIFAVGLLIGAAVANQIDLFALLGLDSAEDLFPADFDALFIFLNNTRAFFVLILGALTMGLLTALGLLFNGVLVGYIAVPVAGEFGVGFILVGLLPHGVLELPALFVAAAVAFRLVHLGALRLLGRRERFLTRPEIRRTVLVVLAAWIVLGVAAVIEFYVTGALLELLFDTEATTPPS